jgi:Spy/CpxP family protein refolding chaperone
MKNLKLLLAALLAGGLGTAAFVTIGHADPQCGDSHGIHGERMGYLEDRHDPLKRLMRHVDLTDAQQTEIKTIIDTSRTDTDNIRQRLRDKRKALYSLATGTDYSLERARELADQQAKLDAELTVARIDTMHRTLQVELAKLRAQRMERKKAWMDDHQQD